MHTMPYADKKRAGEFRATTLKDARKLGLLVSVTQCLRILANPAIQNWREEQVVLAALTLPRLPGENDDAFARRVVEDSVEQVKGAADFGSAIHDAIENYLAEGKRTDLATLQPYCDPCYQWIDENVEEAIGCEFAITSLAGYAGRVDAKVVLKRGSHAFEQCIATNPRFNGIVLMDAKTRKSVNGKIASYDNDQMQLSAYHKADQDSPSGLLRPTAVASFLVSSNEPLPPIFKPWSQEDLEWGWKAFDSVLTCWKILNQYDPSK